MPHLLPLSAEPATVKVSVDRSHVGMGRTVALIAQAIWPDHHPVAGVQLLPYVNGRRWGPRETADASGRAVFYLPLPSVGLAQIQVQAQAPARPAGRLVGLGRHAAGAPDRLVAAHVHAPKVGGGRFVGGCGRLRHRLAERPEGGRKGRLARLHRHSDALSTVMD